MSKPRLVQLSLPCITYSIAPDTFNEQALGGGLHLLFGSRSTTDFREGFFFRGLLQQWMAQWTGSATLALASASILFGLVHLGFRGFPNWKCALAAAVAGWFYGRAYNEAKSIRASMVTHALVVTMWFRSLVRFGYSGMPPLTFSRSSKWSNACTSPL